MSWLELSVQIEQEAVESVSELFATAGYNGGVAIEQPFVGSPDGPEYTIDPHVPVTSAPIFQWTNTVMISAHEWNKGLWALGMMRSVGELQSRVVGRRRLGELLEIILSDSAHRKTLGHRAFLAGPTSQSPTTSFSNSIPAWPLGPVYIQRPN